MFIRTSTRRSSKKALTRYHYFARRNELLLDIDTRSSIRTFLKNYPIALLKARKATILNPRRNHLHVYITLENKLSYDNLFSLACWLGSDSRRECANYNRLISGATKPSLLVEYQRVRDFRGPDLVCQCPRNYPNTKRKMPSCEHLINFRPFHFHDGTLLHQVNKLLLNEQEHTLIPKEETPRERIPASL